jgi:carbonic anhydrase
VHLILVLGHSDCGAVAATVKGGPVPGHIRVIVAAIRPAVEHAKDQPGNLLDNAIKENAREIVTKLTTSSSLLAERVNSGQLKVVGGVYELHSGKVLLLH